MTLSQTVILKKRIVTPDGSVIDPRLTPYHLSEIPIRYRTEEYITYGVAKEQKVVYGDGELNFIPLKNNGLIREVVVKPQTVIRTIEEEQPVEINPISLPVEESPIVEEKKVIDINTASFDELTSIQGIGKTMANRVISEREIKPFADCNELDERVKRPFKESWWNYSDKLCFS